MYIHTMLYIILSHTSLFFNVVLYHSQNKFGIRCSTILMFYIIIIIIINYCRNGCMLKSKVLLAI